MHCDTLFAKVDELYPKYIDIWEKVCNIESPTNCKEGVDAVGSFFVEWAKQRGWKVEVRPEAVSGDVVCITMNPDANGAPISFSGHMDTVHPVGSFGSPAVTRDDEKIYGPGVLDCKGGIVAAALTMDALQACGYDKRPIQLLLQSDEESGSNGSNKATINDICQKAKDSVAFFNLEGHTEGEACLIRKGIVTFRFAVGGIEAHASQCAEKGASAIADAAYKIIELEKIKDAEGLTCNVGVIEGGSVVNTVPGKCEFKVNVRFASADQLAWIRDYVQKLAQTEHVAGCKTTVEEVSFRVAMEPSEKNAALLQKMNDIFAANGLPRLTASKRTGGSDAADVTSFGIPCVDSIGVSGGSIHSPDEYAILSSLKHAAYRLCAVAANLE